MITKSSFSRTFSAILLGATVMLAISHRSPPASELRNDHSSDHSVEVAAQLEKARNRQAVRSPAF